MSENKFEAWMRLAIEAANESGTAYGAVIVNQEGNVVAKRGNTVKPDHDATCHAEMNALRTTHKISKSASLEGYTLITTVEPCSMCLAASLWSQIGTIVFGAGVEDVLNAGGDQIALPSEKLNQSSPKPLKLEGGVLHNECVELVNQHYNK